MGQEGQSACHIDSSKYALEKHTKVIVIPDTLPQSKTTQSSDEIARKQKPMTVLSAEAEGLGKTPIQCNGRENDSGQTWLSLI